MASGDIALLQSVELLKMLECVLVDILCFILLSHAYVLSPTQEHS